MMKDQPDGSGTSSDMDITLGARGADRPAGRQDEDHARRLVADAQLVALLATDNFSGPRFEKFQHHLCQYGRPVLMAWLRTGEIFLQCHSRGLYPKKPPRPLEHEDRMDIADNTLATALRAFRQKALIEGRWDPARGATLTVYFTNSLPHHFCNAYRSWLTEVRKDIFRQSRTESTSDLTHIAAVTPDSSNPEDDFILRERVEEASRHLDTRTFRTLKLVTAGYHHAEIAEILGISVRAVEGILYRFNKRREARDEEDRLG